MQKKETIESLLTDAFLQEVDYYTEAKLTGKFNGKKIEKKNLKKPTLESLVEDDGSVWKMVGGINTEPWEVYKEGIDNIMVYLKYDIDAYKWIITPGPEISDEYMKKALTFELSRDKYEVPQVFSKINLTLN